MRLAAATVLALASATMAQTPEPPLYVRLSDNTCIFDGITRYRITRTAHTLDYNTSTGAYFVRTGYPLEAGGIDCPSFFDPNITTSLTTVYQAGGDLRPLRDRRLGRLRSDPGRVPGLRVRKHRAAA